MKTIGMLGGMSWESTESYYKFINQGIKEKLGGLNSAKILLYSFNFNEIADLLQQNNWQKLTEMFIFAAKSLATAGANFLIICTNTMHKVVPEMEAEIKIPILHIIDFVAEELITNNVNKVGLLGTKFTMEDSFYKDRLKNKFNIETIIPEKEDRKIVHGVIYNELCKGIILEKSKEKYIKIINSLKKLGAEAVILGCTEIALLITKDTQVTLYDTTKIHCKKTVELALK